MDKKKLTCIIVEDEIAYQKIMAFFINQIDRLEIIGAYTNTVQASLQIEKKKPDIIFLDINISGLEGPEFIGLLEYKPKVIVVSGHSEEFMKVHYENIPYEAYIQKPVTPENLKAALMNL